MSRTLEQIVRDFALGWERPDPDVTIAALTEDIVHQNVPIPAMTGHAEFRSFITPNLRNASSIMP